MEALELIQAAKSVINIDHTAWKRHAAIALSKHAGQSIDEVYGWVVETLGNSGVATMTTELIIELGPMYVGLLEWARGGYPHFSLGADFFHALAVTDFGDPSDEPLYMPFNSYTISFPKSAAFDFASRAFVHRMAQPAGSKLSDGLEWKLYRAILMVEPTEFTQWTIGTSRKALFDEIEAGQFNAMQNGRPYHGPLGSEIKVDLKNMTKLRTLIANMLSYVEAAGPLPTVPRAKNAEPAAVERIHKTQQNFEVGRIIKLDGATRRALQAGSSNAAGWKLMQKFMVRGHWRNQVHGAGRALRRRQWISPFYKGPENVAAALERTYEVE